MLLTLSQMRGVKRRCSIGLRAALLIVFLTSLALGQTQGPSTDNGPTPAGHPPAEKVPLSDVERAELLKLIKSLQERVEKLDAKSRAILIATTLDILCALARLWENLLIRSSKSEFHA